MKILEVILLIVMLGILITGLYALWVNLPRAPVELESYSADNIQIQAPDKSYQFYPNMRFRDKKISYGIEEACTQGKRADIIEALQILSQDTILEFYESSDPEIKYYCSEIAPEPEQANHFVAGEGGPTDIINTSVYSVIYKGKVSLYKPEKCDGPKIAIHETFHALGFDHNNNKLSIMYPVTDCKQEIDQYLIDEINSLYSTPSLPDLGIENLVANKSVRYINFDIVIVNYGLKDTEKAKLILSADGEKVKEFDLNKIGIGTRKLLSVQNIRGPREFSDLVFEVFDTGNQEISEENNKVIVRQTNSS